MRWTDNQAREEWARARGRLLEGHGRHRGNRPAALAWALKFAQLSLDQLSHGDRFNLLLELFHFCRDGGGTHERPDSINKHAAQDLELIEKNTEQFAGYWRDLQRLVIDQVELFLKGEPVILPIRVTLNIRRGIHPPRIESEVTGSSFQYQFAHLLSECGDRIRLCRGCKKYFLAGRSDKKWCSGLCQATIYQQEHPPKKPKQKKAKGGQRHGTKRR